MHVSFDLEPMDLAHRCAEQLRVIRADVVAAEARHAPLLARGASLTAPSLRNLIHYLSLRRHDIRPLQEHLARLGLSSLGRAESHTLYSIDAVLHALGALTGLPEPWPEPSGSPGFDDGPGLLALHTAALLGPRPGGRGVRIMVTLPAEAALDRALVVALVAKGMDVARINCAHDDPDRWARMASSVRDAARSAGRRCLVQADLGGPKLRTGPCEREIVLREGDVLFLTRNGEPGAPAGLDGEGSPARIGCSLPEVLEDVLAGDRVFFDDGKIGGRVEAVDVDAARLRITLAKPAGSRLRADRGINLPDTELHLPALTGKDRHDLAHALRFADIVALSFVERSSDVVEIDAEMRRLGEPSQGLVLKIETRRGFENLPGILLEAIGKRPLGVMIARGDMAIECGWERLAEIQEEMLWFCEAAHVPVIWATQVLDRLSRKGLPTRAEVTDAAMGERAECVMLNKGPHVLDAIGLLDGILRKMEAHQRKRSPRLRALAVSELRAG
jgi:pyruvate kinase